MKNLVRILSAISLILSSSFIGDYYFVKTSPKSDDTAQLQALLTAGTPTLPKGKTYNISSSLIVTKSIDLNGDIINYTNTTGVCIRIQNQNVTLQNGKIVGTWDDELPYSAAGPTGILVRADNCTISHLSVTKFAFYGICIISCNKPAVTGCHVSKIGYIGIYYTNDGTNSTIGGRITNDTIDRSTVAPANVHQTAMAIRAHAIGTDVTTSDWIIENNLIKMPNMPTDWTAECLEVRAMTNSKITGNTFIGGSISASMVRTSGITFAGNRISGVQLEGIEYSDSQNVVSENNIITSSAGVGILLDGVTGCNGITFTGDNISGTTSDCIHTTAGTQNLKIVNAVLIASNGAKPISLLGTTGVTITGTTLKGDNSGQMAVYLTNCPGNITINGGSISNFTKCIVYISNTTSGMATNNVSVSGNTVTGVPTALGTYLLNGAAVGSNVNVTLK